MIDDAPLCYIGESNIEGKGLRANRPILNGQLVVNYGLCPFDRKLFSDLTQEEINKCRWVGLTEEICLVPLSVSIKFFYANHSNNPNCLWITEKCSLFANKDIDINEEITYDYTLDIKPKNWPKPSWI